jgi:hypothetical protein
MKQINRRKLLKTTGAGAGIALGAGAASGNDTAVTSSEPVEPDQSVVSSFTAEATTARIAIDTDNPEQQQEIDIGAPLVTIENGTISDNGDMVAATADIVVPDLIDVLLGLDPKQVVIDILQAIDIQEDIIDNPDVTLDNLLQQISDFLFKLDLDATQAGAIGELVGILAAEFNLPGGTLLEQIISGLLEDPTVANLESLLNTIAEQFVDGPPNEVNNMEDLLTVVTALVDGVENGDFAGLKSFLITQIQELNLENLLSIITIEVDPDPIEGTWDPTVDSPDVLMDFPLTTVTLTPILDVENPPADPPELEFSLDITLTSGESNALSGEVPSLDTGNNTAQATVVDNEFTADITEFDLVGLVEDLDLVSLIETIFDLLNIDPTEYDFDIGQFVDDANITSIVENAELLKLLDGLIQDEPGRHAVEADLDMTFDDLDSALDIELGPPPVPGFDGEPTDKDGDGLYEDIDGSGEFDIFDVQGLFTSLDTDAVQNNPEAYNFNGDENPQEVTIFDVQGLFIKLQEQS